MKLLICTQAVDVGDSDLGFFVRWIEEFAKQCEKVTVVCLHKGEYSLPNNVEVCVLGNAPRFVRTLRLWRICIARCREYDAVFVHMNPEFIVAAGLLWRILRKRVALWYTHKSVNLKLRIAVLLVHIVFTASKESFRLRSKKVRVVGHGIDTDFFSFDANAVRGDFLLSVGRLMPSKRHDLAIRAAAFVDRELRIIGEGPERENLEALVHALDARVRFLGGLTQPQLRDEYQKAAYLIHTSETGSLDKVVLEALACGLPVVTISTVLTGIPVIVASATPGALAEKILTAHQSDTQSLVAYVREHHSLQHLIPAILYTI